MATHRQDFIRKKFGADVGVVLQKLYVEQQIGVQRIGHMFGCAPNHVLWLLKKFGIRSRTHAEAGGLMRGNKNPMFHRCKSRAFRNLLSRAQKRRFAAGAVAWNKGKCLPDFNHLRGRFVGENAFNWRGGVRHKDGYICVYAPSHPCARRGVVYEHRLVMERHLNRILRTDEVVHHINGNRSDNRLSNLTLMTTSEHRKAHAGDIVEGRWGRRRA